MEIPIMFYNPEEYEIRVWIDSDKSKVDAIYNRLPDGYLWVSGRKPKEIYYKDVTYLCLEVGRKKISYSQGEVDHGDRIDVYEMSEFMRRKMWKYL